MNSPDPQIRVGGYVAASLLLEREPKRWHALVLIDSGKQATEFVETHAVMNLVLRFDDVEEPRPNMLSPTVHQIAQALVFARGKDQLLVSCRAGRGRSVALAFLITYRMHGADRALALLDPTRHRPNRLVVSHGEMLLDPPGALAAFDGWRAAHAHVKLSDYYDEMEREFEALEAEGATNRISL